MTEPPAAPKQASRAMRPFWLALGWLAVGLAAAGVVLPLLPTTPFLLVAAWAFGKSSEKWRRWLYSQKTFGPIIQDWEQHGVIPIWGKCAALGAMTVSLVGLSMSDRLPLWALIAIGLTLACVGYWIATRPSRPPTETSE